KVRVTGATRTSARVAVEFEPRDDAASFLLHLTGETRARAVIERRPVVIRGHGAVGFTASRRASFDGERYRGEEPAVDAHFRPEIDDIETPPGLRGLIVRLVANRQVRKTMPENAGKVLREARTKV